jgi:hypothetical protein
MNHFAPAPTKPIIAIADLDKLDIRVGMIESVEFVAGSDKLVKLTVEFGDQVFATSGQTQKSSLKAARRSSSSTSHRARWQARYPRRCSWTSATPMASTQS